MSQKRGKEQTGFRPAEELRRVRVPVGPLVYDLYVPDAPKTARNIVVLFQTVRVPVTDTPDLQPEVAVARRAQVEPFIPHDVFHHTDTDPGVIPEVVSDIPDRAALEEELTALLDADLIRSEALERVARERRASGRAEGRATHRSQPRAVVLHVRSRHARSRRRTPVPVRPARSRPGPLPPSARSSPWSKPHREREQPSIRRLASLPHLTVPPLSSPWRSGEPKRRWDGAGAFRDHRASWNLRELTRVLIGSTVLTGVVWAAADLARLPGVGTQVAHTASRGAEQILTGVSALAGADTQAGSQEFAAAGEAFRRAATELSEATTIIQRVIGRVDPAARLQKAETLLEVGQTVARLGEDAARVVALFQESSRSLTETLAMASPLFSALQEQTARARAHLRRVSASGLPGDVQGQLQTLEALLRSVDRLLVGFLQSQHVVLELLGAAQDRQYLLLFQNHRELRPTGGFIGSFALVDVSRGAVRKVRVDTIYNPDGQLKEFLAPPEPLKKITDRWYARDANWFAEFPRSAQKVATLLERSGGPTVDGVMAVTPLVLEDILQLTGPIPLPEYGVTVTAENVVEETQRFVTYEYDRTHNEPKAFIADLLPEIVAKVTALPKARWGELADVLLAATRRKQVLVYFRDTDAQTLAQELQWAGTLPDLPEPSRAVMVDHFGRVEANIGGHKTDDRVEQHVAYDLTLGSAGGATATLVVTRHHRGGAAGEGGVPPEEDPARKSNIVYERTFVPLGSEVLEARGFTIPAEVPAPFQETEKLPLALDPDLEAWEHQQSAGRDGMTIGTESGMTTFGGWVITQPNETSVTVLRYRLPWSLPRPSLIARVLRYELLVTQQPGHLPVPTEVTVRAPEGVHVAWAGPEDSLTESGAQRVRYTEILDGDVTWGAVFVEDDA